MIEPLHLFWNQGRVQLNLSFRKQEALQYHIDEHRRKTAETEKEQNKKDKKENQENTKGDKSDNEINAALGLAALGQLSDQKEGGSGPPSLTKGSKGGLVSAKRVYNFSQVALKA